MENKEKQQEKKGRGLPPSMPALPVKMPPLPFKKPANKMPENPEKKLVMTSQDQDNGKMKNRVP